ncbi:MAG TPA: hypothetical protein VJZ00_01345 [Thermoanaerobaculia bacterium]|nr:hypothetical protein [Thermoanaerobaculia bacterium]
MRFVYRWTEGKWASVGAVSDAHLRAWEYELASDDALSAHSTGTAHSAGTDTVRLWKTRRPDLAPAELWVGDREVALNLSPR